ncbi:DUF2913 family protein [Vibrio sinaloensis]|uniref:DUF2913 family protein n=1 Tax=Photobacterium sp. (strain ATCC 43367) TaxID=379097 RepID=UPI002066C8DA|nr:DUF2913 family protein [Vibrio sinaloensis]UPQ89181.1 DUF2913 family protein [Vibrio sinaloensis]
MRQSPLTSEQALYDLICHSLLALLMSATLTQGRVTESQRRQVLVKFYKRALTNPNYKSVRQDIRKLLAASRDERVDVYAILKQLNDDAFKLDTIDNPSAVN